MQCLKIRVWSRQFEKVLIKKRLLVKLQTFISCVWLRQFEKVLIKKRFISKTTSFYQLLEISNNLQQI